MTIKLLLALLITSPLIAAEISKVPPKVLDPGIVRVMVLLDLPNKEYGINRVQDEVNRGFGIP